MSRPLAHRLVAALADAGTPTLFGLPGGGPNLDVVGAAEAAGLRFVLAHTETAAAIMAGTHGLLTGGPGAVVVTRGPGAAAATNGLAQATLDRYPLVAVTDCVPAATAHRVAHQRLDQPSMLAPAAKVSATVTDGHDDATLAALVGASTSWPFGAVHLDYDPSASASASNPAFEAADRLVAGALADALPDHVTETGAARDGGSPEPEMVAAAVRLVTQARRPLLIVGMEAAVVARTHPEIARLLCEPGWPVLTTYQAVGTVPTEHPVAAGLFTNGSSEAPLVEAADLIVTVGLDPVEPIPAPWTAKAPVIRLSGQSEVDPYLPSAVEVVGDLATVLAEVLTPVAGSPDAATDWTTHEGAVHRARVRHQLAAAPTPEPSGFGPLELVAGLARHHERIGTVTVDAGAHFLAVMPMWPVAEPLRLLISNGLATMGFALPAAIGAALARPGEPVLAITGDGGLSMVAAELETVARLDLPVTVVVMNDSALSLIEIKQGADHGGHNAVRYRPVDYAAVARGFGLDAEVVTSTSELDAILDRWDDPWSRPRLIDARIDPSPYPHLLRVTRG